MMVAIALSLTASRTETVPKLGQMLVLKARIERAKNSVLL
jgi:hypothetical protein